MTENEIAKEIVDAAFKIHVAFGPSLLESAYEALLAHELQNRGLELVCQQEIPLFCEGVRLEKCYRVDLLVEGKVIVEVKAHQRNSASYRRQLLTYLRLADKRLGLVINFASHRIKDGITRVVNGLKE